MRDSVLWRKESSIIMLLAKAHDIDAERALKLFCSSETYRQLSDRSYGLQPMSDQYLVDNILSELR